MMGIEEQTGSLTAAPAPESPGLAAWVRELLQVNIGATNTTAKTTTLSIECDNARVAAHRRSRNVCCSPPDHRLRPAYSSARRRRWGGTADLAAKARERQDQSPTLPMSPVRRSNRSRIPLSGESQSSTADMPLSPPQRRNSDISLVVLDELLEELRHCDEDESTTEGSGDDATARILPEGRTAARYECGPVHGPASSGEQQYFLQNSSPRFEGPSCLPSSEHKKDRWEIASPNTSPSDDYCRHQQQRLLQLKRDVQRLQQQYSPPMPSSLSPQSLTEQLRRFSLTPSTSPPLHQKKAFEVEESSNLENKETCHCTSQPSSPGDRCQREEDMPGHSARVSEILGRVVEDFAALPPRHRQDGRSDGNEIDYENYDGTGGGDDGGGGGGDDDDDESSCRYSCCSSSSSSSDEGTALSFCSYPSQSSSVEGH